MQKLLFSNFNSRGYLVCQTHRIDAVIMRLKQLGYFGIERVTE